jgi:hypothetical protein
MRTISKKLFKDDHQEQNITKQGRKEDNLAQKFQKTSFFGSKQRKKEIVDDRSASCIRED